MKRTEVSASSVWLAVLGAILFLLLVRGESLAATYYVSPAGNDGNSGSATAPFKTIQKAANAVNAGDTVIVKDGVYTDTDGNGYIVYLNYKNGTSASWITFRAEHKWGAVLDGETYTTATAWVIENSSYIRIEGFDQQHLKSGNLHVGTNSHDIYFYRNRVHDAGRVQIFCSDPLIDYGQGGGGFTSGSSYNITFDSNIFYNLGRLQGGCSSYDYNHDHGLYLRGDTTTVVNNVFYNCLSGWPIQADGGANNPTGVQDLVIVNNTFYGDNPGAGGHILLWYDVGNITIENNISHSNGGYLIKNATQQQYNWPDSYGQGKVYNNLVYGGTVYQYAPTKNWTASGNIEGKDPKFANLGAYDFHLQGGSPAIDKGVYVAGLDYDVDGNPINGIPDIGAYEYVDSIDVTAPSTPSGLSASAVSSAQINLSWNASTDNVGVSGYKVYRNSALIATVAATGYSDKGLLPSTTYTYKVASFDAAGNTSGRSIAVSLMTVDSTPPTAPVSLTARAASSSRVNLSWQASTDNVGVAGYKVYRNSALIATVATTGYSDAGLLPLTTYTYSVAAYDAAGNSSAKSFRTVSTLNPVIYLSNLQYAGTPVNGWGPVERDMSVGETAAGDGHPITLDGITYAKGLGVHTNSEIIYNLGKKYSRFVSDLGIDDEVASGSVVFQIWADGAKIYDSGIVTRSSAIKNVSVSVKGKSELKLVVTGAGDGNTSDHADWAGAYLLN